MIEKRRNIYLVRHGVTAWNREMRLQGQTDIPLDAEGMAQAQCVALRLASLPNPPQALISSDLTRAKQTAHAIAEQLGLPVHAMPEIRETHLGYWEGLNQAEIIARGEEDQLRKYQENSFLHRPPGAEELESAWERMINALATIKAQFPTEHIAIVGHGGSLRVLLYDALGAPVSSLNRIWLANASLSIIEERFREGNLFKRGVSLLNDVSHLQKAE